MEIDVKINITLHEHALFDVAMQMLTEVFIDQVQNRFGQDVKAAISMCLHMAQFKNRGETVISLYSAYST